MTNRWQKSRARICSLLAAACLLVALLVTVPATAANATSRPTITFGAEQNSLSSMSPLQTFGPLAHELAFLEFSALMMYAPGDAKKALEPDLATKVPTPSTVNGKQVWTVDVRQGVTCPQGVKTPAYELTSADVVFSLQQAANPKLSLWAGQYTDYASVQAVNKFTVAITLKTPESAAVFLPTIANYLGGFIVCSRAVKAEGQTMFGDYPVGTGPFMFKSLDPGVSATLVANDSYYKGKPAAAGMVIKFYSSSTAEEAALLSGQIDAVQAPFSGTDAWDQEVSSHSGFKVVAAPVFGETYLFFDTTNKYLSNVLVRRAIAYASNRSSYVESVGKTAQPAVSAWDSSFAYGIPNSYTEKMGLAYNFDISKAKQLMTKAGYPNGFTLTADVDSEAPTIMEILQEQLKPIHITLKLNSVDPTTDEAAEESGNQPIFTNALGFFGSPQQVFQNYFASPSAGPGDGALNWTHYTGANSLIAQAASETNIAVQEKLWKEADNKILSDMAALPLYTNNNVYGGVCGFTWGGTNPPVEIPSSWDGSYQMTVNTHDTKC
jgi:peptide/nickel transport system substrate-binding protein